VSDEVDVLGFETRLEIRLNRPAKKNALTSAMYGRMADALERAEADGSPPVVVFRSEGDCFCAGNDISDFLRRPAGVEAEQVGRFLEALARSSRLLVAAVQGQAIGVGATMLLHFDHIAAGEDTILSFPFVRLGLVPEAASSLLLPLAVGRLRATEILITGRPVRADEALSLGLLSRVVPSGQQLPAAREFADRLATLPPDALLATKRLLRRPMMTVQERMAEESGEFRQRLMSEEFQKLARG
jgi:enoyl-CoA hydratase/carnithine racemase